jgi:glycosyltransferase 2 family protein
MPNTTDTTAERSSCRPGRLARLRSRSWWPWFKRGATLVFFALVGWLIFSQAREVDWAEVLNAVRQYSPLSLALAMGLAVCSLLVYSCFDLLARRYTGHTLGTRTVMTVTFISYVFNLNLGSLVGAIAFRYRLYSRLGLEPGTITRITTFSMLTNWAAYLMLGGFVFAVVPPSLPEDWPITEIHLRLIGLLLLAIASAYVALCAFRRERTLHVRGHEIALPTVRMAGLQLLIGTINWLLISSVIYVLLQQRIEFPAVVSVLLLAAVAGVITHVPAGLGVLEAVFVALLSHRMQPPALLAALMTYRVVYYLIPLMIAAAVYLVTEARAKKLGSKGRKPASRQAA